MWNIKRDKGQKGDTTFKNNIIMKLIYNYIIMVFIEELQVLKIYISNAYPKTKHFLMGYSSVLSRTLR